MSNIKIGDYEFISNSPDSKFVQVIYGFSLKTMPRTEAVALYRSLIAQGNKAGRPLQGQRLASDFTSVAAAMQQGDY